MTVESVLKRRMSEILLEETPYVLEEARFGMFDIAAYVPDDMAFQGLEESKRLSAARACNKYENGVCSDRKKDFLGGYEPVLDDNCSQESFLDKKSGKEISRNELAELICDKKTLKRSIGCILDDEGKGCSHLEKRLEWEKGFLSGFRLGQGLHLFEFKSDHDNVNRFLEQMPHYSIFADYLWLVIGESQKVPKWLPTYVGVFQESGGSFVKVKESDFIRRLPPLSKPVLRECGIPERAIDGDEVYIFLRKWLINSIFYRGNGLVMPMPELSHLFRDYEKRKEGRQSTL